MDIASRRPRTVELVAAPLLGLLGAAEVLVPFSSRVGSSSEAWSVAAVAAVAVALLWVRRAPWVPAVVFAVAWLTVLLAAGSIFLLFYGQLVTMLVFLFMATRYGRGRTPMVAIVVVVAFFLGLAALSEQMRSPGELTFHWTLGILTASAGFGLRRYEQRAQESTRRAIEAEVGAAEAALRAVVEERTRIARELHDIVAHAVTSMVVQAGAAGQADGDRAFVDRALEHIRQTGNDALAEMRRLVTMLREDEAAPLAPQPRLDSLPELVAASSAYGPHTRLEVVGAARELPAGLDLTAFRIVQEALTNVRRHAGASECVVRLSYDSDEIRLEIVDDGAGGPAEGSGGGHGLTGMRERVGLYGGCLVAGPEPERGFAVRAALPVAP